MSAKRSAVTAGFTIIEVMIVLAIAGLIMLLVFQAIPTLERSGRNNQRKQDISAILQAVSHHELNSSGSFPPDCSHDCFDTGNLLANAKLTYYTQNTQVIVKYEDPGATAPSSHNPNTNSEIVYVYNHQLCGGNQTATSTGAAYSDIVALYALEGASTSTSQCQQL